MNLRLSWINYKGTNLKEEGKRDLHKFRNETKQSVVQGLNQGLGNVEKENCTGTYRDIVLIFDQGFTF